MTTPEYPRSADIGPGDDPDRIRRDIERTQAALSSDVDTLAEKVTPGRIVERRVGRVKGAANRWKEAVMGSGSPSHGGHDARRAASSAAGTVSDTASSALESAQDAPRLVKQQTRGNPLAAGLIAFGVGWLAASVIPAARKEQELAGELTDRARDLGAPLAENAKQVAAEVKDNLAGPARDAAESVRSTAADAGRTVAEEGRSAAGDVRSST